MEILIIGIIVVIGGGIVGLGLYQKKKRKEASWSGSVIDKSIQETVHNNDNNNYGEKRTGFSIGSNGFNNNTAVTKSYNIKVKTDTGEEISWPISSGMYETLNIGDRLVKNPGTEIPEITDKADVPASEATQPETNSQDNNSTPPIVPAA